MMSRASFKHLVKECLAEVIVEGDMPHEQWKDTFGQKMPGEFTVETSQPEPYDPETDTFQPSPRERTAEVSAYNKFEANIAQLKKQYPNISFGYIGNLWNEPGMPKDDRSWYVWNGRDKFGGYETKDLPAMWDRWEQKREQFLKGSAGTMREAAGQVNPTKLSTGERNRIGKEFADAGLDGNIRFEKKEHGLQNVTRALDKLGFQLDMVSGDLIMGDKGQRMFVFRRKNDAGADPFTEKPEIQNSRIVFVWENLAQPGQTPRFEILAYAS